MGSKHITFEQEKAVEAFFAENLTVVDGWQEYAIDPATGRRWNDTSAARALGLAPHQILACRKRLVKGSNGLLRHGRKGPKPEPAPPPPSAGASDAERLSTIEARLFAMDKRLRKLESDKASSGPLFRTVDGGKK